LKSSPLSHHPNKAQIRAAVGSTVPDIIAPDLKVLFCGINPGLYSGAVGHHFARPGNRFWPVLHAAGYTDHLLKPEEERDLLAYGYGITNFVNRATALASDLTARELIEGRLQLEEKVRFYKPKILAILGIGAYRIAFERPKAVIGKQVEQIGDTILWVLPNPSGINAHYQLEDLTRLFREPGNEVGHHP
jgi:double-stranded uracil-DNA glycosylase